MDIDKYLARIGLDARPTIDLAGLNKLVQAQLTNVPFEALDIWSAGACPSLEPTDLYEKIVVNHRGGYCFELNTLFRYLLNELGFEAYQAISSLVNEEGVPAVAAHNVIICALDSVKYLIDVGFGGPVPFGAMPLSAGNWESFRLQQREGFYWLDRWEEHHYRPSIRFRDVPATKEELIPLNFYISQKPDSHFRHRLNVSLKRPDGSICVLLGEELRMRTDAGVKVQKIQNARQLCDVLITYFGINVSEIFLEDGFKANP